MTQQELKACRGPKEAREETWRIVIELNEEIEKRAIKRKEGIEMLGEKGKPLKPEGA